MRYTEIIQENTPDDDELFGTPTVDFNDVFNEHDEDQLQAQGFQYGDNPESDISILNDYLEDWGKDFRVVGLSGGEHDLVLQVNKTGALRETDDDELFGDRRSFTGASAEEIKEKFDELYDELYGYEAYWDDEDSDAFQDKKRELDALLGYVRIRWGEGFYNHLKDWGDHEKRQQWLDRYYARQSNDPLVRRGRDDPRITKSGKINKADQKTLARDIGKRIGKHPAPALPESESDDELFGQKQGFVGAAEARKLSDAMYQFLHTFANDREMREWRADEPDQYGAVEFDLYLAYQSLKQGNVIKALAALERNPMGHDIDEWALTFVEKTSGIDMSSAVGLDDDDDNNVYDLVRKARDELPPVELNK